MCLERRIAEITITNKRNASLSLDRGQRTIFKPRLPRKITSSCKINLNKFWGDLEQFYVKRTSSQVISFNSSLSDEEVDNSINENNEKSIALNFSSDNTTSSS